MEVFLGVILMAAAVAKLMDLEEVSLAFEEHWVKHHLLAQALAVAVPVSELSLGVLVILRWWPYLVVPLVLAMLSGFTGALLFSLAQHKRRPCGCFGMLSHANITWWTVMRNLLLLGLTGLLLTDIQPKQLLLFQIEPLWKGMLGLAAALAFLIVIQLIDSEKRSRKAFGAG